MSIKHTKGVQKCEAMQNIYKHITRYGFSDNFSDIINNVYNPYINKHNFNLPLEVRNSDSPASYFLAMSHAVAAASDTACSMSVPCCVFHRIVSVLGAIKLLKHGL